MITPSVSILAQPSVAVVDDNARANHTKKVSKAYLQYLYSKEAQELIGKSGFRPSDQDVIQNFSNQFDLSVDLWTIKDYGGWNKAYQKYFDDGAWFDKIYEY